LGVEQPAVRDEAEQKLKNIGPPCYEHLKRALKHADPEIRDRAKRILDDPAFLLVDEVLRERLASEKSEQWHEVVRGLLKLPLEKLRDVLKAPAKAEGVSGFRAKQLLDVVSSPPKDGLIYGIVLEKQTFKGQPTGIEIWLNVSDSRRSYEKRMGQHHIETLKGPGPRHKRISCGETTQFQVFDLAPGTANVSVRSDFSSTSHGGTGVSISLQPGGYAVRTEYASKLLPSKIDNLWTGSAKSNVVEFEIQD
jgi:hypothetical protein